MENTEITVSMKTAMVEHQHICECYRTAATAIVEMGRSLKNIRDYKLYTALGYESFKNYLESNGDYTFKEHRRIPISNSMRITVQSFSKNTQV